MKFSKNKWWSLTKIRGGASKILKWHFENSSQDGGHFGFTLKIFFLFLYIDYYINMLNFIKVSLLVAEFWLISDFKINKNDYQTGSHQFFINFCVPLILGGLLCTFSCSDSCGRFASTGNTSMKHALPPPIDV